MLVKIPVSKSIVDNKLVIVFDDLETNDVVKLRTHVVENTFSPALVVFLQDGSKKSISYELLLDYKGISFPEAIALEKALDEITEKVNGDFTVDGFLKTRSYNNTEAWKKNLLSEIEKRTNFSIFDRIERMDSPVILFEEQPVLAKTRLIAEENVALSDEELITKFSDSLNKDLELEKQNGAKVFFHYTFDLIQAISTDTDRVESMVLKSDTQLFKEAEADLFDFPAQIKFITTNGTIKSSGEGVMGRGCALQAKTLYKQLPGLLGSGLKNCGNVPTLLLSNLEYQLWSFPVKHNWWETADLELIENSCIKIQNLIQTGFTMALPRPGCGNGKLTWEDVYPIILKNLNYPTVTVLTMPR